MAHRGLFFVRMGYVSNRLSYLLAVIVLLMATGLRQWQLTTLPVGYHEAEFTQIGLTQDVIQRGDIRVFYELDGKSQEGLYDSALALATLFVGKGTIGTRIVSVWASLITLALIFSLGVRLFGRVAGLAAATLMAFMMWSALLSRLVLIEAMLPLLITATLLALARALPVYNHTRSEDSNTINFAVLGALLGIGFYVHPVSLLLFVACLLFVIYYVVVQKPISWRLMGYVGFSFAVAFIVALPYILSSVRAPELSPLSRLHIDGNVLSLVAQNLLGIFVQGDASATYNLPQRPLIDWVSSFVVVVGLVVCGLHWRKPRYALVLFTIVCISPLALLAPNAPNFLAYSVLLPLIALCFGLGISVIGNSLALNIRRNGLMILLVLFGFNFLWSAYDLFVRWPALEDVQSIYHADLGKLAHHIDTTANTTPTIICTAKWEQQDEGSPLDRILKMMNRTNAHLRYANCRSGFIFADGGENQQIILPDPSLWNNLPLPIRRWLDQGTPITGLPQDMALQLQVQEQLADALGVYTTTTPATFPTETDLNDRIPISPPIRFGGNITWLGYEADNTFDYVPGESVPVTTYWRVEGIIPPDLNLFTHILSNPTTIAANRDTISVDPTRLKERDVFVQITRVPLPRTLISREYAVSIGAYQDSSQIRLPVFDNDGQERGTRIFLYLIDVGSVSR